MNNVAYIGLLSTEQVGNKTSTYTDKLKNQRVWTPLKGKKAYLEDWPNNPAYLADIPVNENVGLLLEHAGLTDVDLDCPEAQYAGKKLLKSTLSAGRGGKVRRYLYKGAANNYTYRDIGTFEDGRWTPGDVLLEIRHKGKQFMCPPSIHPDTNESIEWIDDCEPVRLPDDNSIQKAATAALIARHLPDSGRHELAMAYAGFLLRKGLTEDEVLEIFNVAWEYRNAHEEAFSDLEGIVADTAEKIAKDEPATGGNSLTKIIPGMTDALCEVWEWEKVLTPEEKEEQERQERIKRAQDAWPLCEDLAHDKDILSRTYKALLKDGLVGEELNAKLVTLATATLHINEPMSLMIDGPSSGGKSEVIKRVTKTVPTEFLIERQSNRSVP